MENASKALIIAGAILISILLIGVGMLVFSGAQGIFDESTSQMSDQQKKTFNSKFVNYEGAKVTGSNVRALVQDIISSNSTNQDIEDRLIKINGKLMTSSEMSAYKVETINTGKTYKVVMVYGDATGLVSDITITVNK